MKLFDKHSVLNTVREQSKHVLQENYDMEYRLTRYIYIYMCVCVCVCFKNILLIIIIINRSLQDSEKLRRRYVKAKKHFENKV